jgi:hypothetical protein
LSLWSEQTKFAFMPAEFNMLIISLSFILNNLEMVYDKKLNNLTFLLKNYIL